MSTLYYLMSYSVFPDLGPGIIIIFQTNEVNIATIKVERLKLDPLKEQLVSSINAI